MDEAQEDPQIEGNALEPGERYPDGRQPWVTPRVILSESAQHTERGANTFESNTGIGYGPTS